MAQKPIELLVNNLKRHQSAMESLQTEAFLKVFEGASQAMLSSLKMGKKILIGGNGGSASDSQHFAAELMCKYNQKRNPVPCIAITTDTSYLTATANDYSYQDIFIRQVMALGQEGDIFIAISTSGNSQNVLDAIAEAKRKKMIVIGLTGQTGGAMSESPVDHLLKVGAKETARIQEGHILILHAFCQLIDSQLFALD